VNDKKDLMRDQLTSLRESIESEIVPTLSAHPLVKSPGVAVAIADIIANELAVVERGSASVSVFRTMMEENNVPHDNFFVLQRVLNAFSKRNIIHCVHGDKYMREALMPLDLRGAVESLKDEGLEKDVIQGKKQVWYDHFDKNLKSRTVWFFRSPLMGQLVREELLFRPKMKEEHVDGPKYLIVKPRRMMMISGRNVGMGMRGSRFGGNLSVGCAFFFSICVVLLCGINPDHSNADSNGKGHEKTL